MKHYIIFMTLSLVCACRSIQQQSSNTLHNDKTLYQGRIISRQLFRQQDSSNRYWMFRTDTTFYFHPDSGLYASGGRLWLQEIRHRESIGQQSYDSAMRQVHENQQIEQRTTQTAFYKRINTGWYWGILGIVLVGIMLWWKLF